MKSEHFFKRPAKDTKIRKNRKKRFAGIVLILFMICSLIGKSPDEILYKMTTFILPVLTYEAELGEAYHDYASSYEVPEWFYEDEGMPENGDLAVMETDVNEEGAAGAQNDHAEETTGSDDSLALQAAGDSKETMTFIGNASRGTVYTREQLSQPDFLKSKIFVIDGNTGMTQEELDIANLMDTELSLNDLPKLSEIPLSESSLQDYPNQSVVVDTTDGIMENDETVQTISDIPAGSNRIYDTDNLPYKVLIYHTHSSESFVDSRPGVKEDTVVGVGAYLTKLLDEKYGIHTYHDETTYDIIDGQLDRSKAYENSYNGIQKILADNPSIEVVIDLHRDGVDEETHLVTEVNGKPTAKIMFLNGVSRSNLNGEIDYLQNPNKLINLAFSFQLYLAGKEDYGDFVRKIYVRSLRYNLHVMPRTALIEAGAQNNTIEEEMNAMEPLAAMLDKVLRKKE